MQTRVAFNSGEFSPELICRSDLDQYQRGCSVLENWQVSQMGGIKRRKGMRFLTEALSEESRLIPYIYSYEEGRADRYLVEIGGSIIRVLSDEGQELARFESDNSDATKLQFFVPPYKVRYYQQNKLLIITSGFNAPLALEYDFDTGWTLKEWEFKHRPWRYVNELRDYPIEIKKTGNNIEVVFPDGVSEDEKSFDWIDRADYLRASFITEQREARSLLNQVLKQNGQVAVNIVGEVPSDAYVGNKFAVNTDEIIKYWVCVAPDGWATSNYVEGLESPANYSGAFVAAEDIEGFEGVPAYYSIKDVFQSDKIAKGTKIAIKQGYWEYYYCIKEFHNKQADKTKFSDYPGYFVRGLPVGGAIPCRGKWSFYCSGVWFGSYEVRRNYETSVINADWEDRGISFSRNDAASNTSISGTEEDEECYLRLFLTRSRRMSDKNLVAGFPQDGCANRLIVESYKHDMVLRGVPNKDEFGNTLSVNWTCNDLVQPDWSSSRTIKDWSWAAFSGRYGYPLHCSAFQQRLVFAATDEQPLTVWFSRIDDIDNFLVGDVDDAAMTLTLSAPSQNPICWVQAQDDRIMLGTSTTEYTIGSSSANLAFSSTSARARSHSYVGSAETPAIAAINKAVFVERGSGRVHEYGWNEESAGYIPRELSIFAPHIGAEHKGFGTPTLLTKPDVVLVWTLGDGQLGLCTYNTMQEVRAWHRWTTDGFILSACALPDGKREDRLYLIVKRENRSENGILLNKVVNIEVVDNNSDYVDCDTRDYTSTMITNPLQFLLQERVERRNENGFYLRFGAPFDYEPGCLEVSVTGDNHWMNPDWNPGTVEGWKEVRAYATWHYEKQVGIRVRGNRGCHILGLQG